MSRVVVSRSGAGWTWWLQADLQTGCEILVRGAAVYPDETACRNAARRFRRINRWQVLSVRDNDGFWRLRFHDRAGERIEKDPLFHRESANMIDPRDAPGRRAHSDYAV